MSDPCGPGAGSGAGANTRPVEDAFESEYVRYHAADAASGLRELAGRSVHACVSSPPYYGLREYLAEDADPAGREIGAEANVEDYIASLAVVFAEVHRVLRDDGTLWVVVADTHHTGSRASARARSGAGARPRGGPPPKPKDLLGVPWRLAAALQGIGFYWRQTIIWDKAGMGVPEAVKDRPTAGHEYILFFSKSARYYYDAEAIAEPARPRPTAKPTGPGEEPLSGMTVGYAPPGSRPDRQSGLGALEGRLRSGEQATRNARTVWRIPPSGAGAMGHYAAFPVELARRCVLAATSAGGVCPVCGTPRIRQGEPCGVPSQGGLPPERGSPACPQAHRGQAYPRLFALQEDPATSESFEKVSEARSASKRGPAPGSAPVLAEPARLKTSVRWFERWPERWLAGCGCRVKPSDSSEGPGAVSGDLELIATPRGRRRGTRFRAGEVEEDGSRNGSRAGASIGSRADPSASVGRAGFSRPRAAGEGRRFVTRYEQRRYAAQLRASPRRADMAAEASEFAGASAYAHYERTDRSGARPIPEELLSRWLRRGWLKEVTLPEVPVDGEGAGGGTLPEESAVVLDPFMGAATTAVAARSVGRRAIGFDLDRRNIAIARRRLAQEVLF